MKKPLKIGAFVLASVVSMSAYSQDSTQAFASCLADALNGKERKEMAKWIFLYMSVHPTLEAYAQATIDDRESMDRYIGKLVTRLLTESCPAELRAANEADPLAIQKGFEFVGQVAMQEIITNQDAARALSGYARYVDQEKITAVIGAEKPNE